MVQQQTAAADTIPVTRHKISFSVGTKLLISIGAMLIALIIFLSAATIILLTEDKQAYTFDSKSTEALLTGRQFSTTVGHVVDTLRQALAEADPTRPVSPQESQAVSTLINNQSDAVAVATAMLDSKDGRLTPVAFFSNPKVLEAAHLDLDQNKLFSMLTQEWVQTALSDINSDGLGFVNLSRTEGNPMMAVIFADKGRGGAQGIPVAIAVSSLSDLLSELKGLNLTIATRSGWVLFDTNITDMYSRTNISDDPLIAAAKGVQVRTGTKDYTINGKRYLGGYAKPGYNLVVMTRTEWKKAMRATYSLTEKFILLGCMAVGLGVIFAIFFSKTLTAPIKRLYSATNEVAQGKFDLNLEIQSGDEIGSLTESFNVMSGKIRGLLHESVEKAILEKEIDVASTVQKTLIPPNDFDHDLIQIRSHYQAASRCGGDWWGFFVSNNKMVFGIADATGHGVPSALITASAHSAFSVLKKLVEDQPTLPLSPAWMLSYLNRSIHDSSKGNIMMTYFMGVIDFNAKTLTYANAAHNPPWLFTCNGDKYKLNSLTSVGSRLGEQSDLPPIEEKTLSIGANDILFFYTDGLTEGKSMAGDMFGKKKVRQLVEANLSNGPAVIVDTLINEFMKFNEGKALDDDVTIAAAKMFAGSTPSA
jgi:sigma-B regulation protein RsbU (phosphoserine phosphatase)